MELLLALVFAALTIFAIRESIKKRRRHLEIKRREWGSQMQEQGIETRDAVSPTFPSTTSRSANFALTDAVRPPTFDIQRPWANRQYRNHDDPDDKPSGDRFENWDEAFNRPVGDDPAFEIEYADDDGTVTKRTVTVKSMHLVRSEPWIYIKAHCSLRGAIRTFRTDRILSTRNLRTNRKLRDLGQYLRGRY